MATTQERIDHHKALGEHWAQSIIEGQTTRKIVRDPRFFTFTRDAIVRNECHGGWEAPRAGWDDIPENDTQEFSIIWDQIPDFSLVEYTVFPSEEGVAIYSVFEGTAKDTPRSRSMGLANKRLRMGEVDMYYTNEDLEINRHVLFVLGQNAITALMMEGWQEGWVDDGSAREGYDAAVAKYAETGHVVDSNKPITPTRGTIQWYADGQILPLEETTAVN